jgi:hypothetical protein
LSCSLNETFKFVSSGIRPDCWYFIEIENEEEEEILLKIVAIKPERFILLKGEFESKVIERIPVNMIFDEAESDNFKKRILNYENKRELLNLICSHKRNPLKADEWISNSLDSCYIHVKGGTEFPDCSEGERLKDLEILRNWHFTAMNRERDQLLRLTFRIFEDFNILKEFEISEERFKLFLLAVNCNYFDNPYHNFCHVVDVLQCCYYLLRGAAGGNLQKLLGSVHLFALLIGCLCHDLGHPSFGNNFLKDSEHPLAILFNDSSVLENYHSMVLFSILRCPLYNWTETENSNFSKKDFRKCVLSCILGTDMSNHFDFIKQFNETFPKLNEIKILSSPEKIQLAIALIKCSDISNVLRPFPIAKSWGIALLNEFFLQGDYEKLLNLPIGPLNDRNTLKTGPAQHQFLTVVAAPLYRAVSGKIPGLTCFDQWIQENAENWLNFKDE